MPPSLRRDMFSVFYPSPTTGYIGEYKTLYRLKGRFFWPHMRNDIKAWSKACSYCNHTNRWRRRGSELLSSWPVSSPFAILHADLWCPGDYTDYTGSHYLLNVICDLTQFVVVVPVTGSTSALMAKYFMQDVLLKFGLCLLVVIDDGTPFKSAFTAACIVLKIPFEYVAKRNHKSLLIEKMHRFLNKVVTIAASDRSTLYCFVEAGIAAGYAWNSVPIDSTDIIRSIPAISCELRFPLDLRMASLPKLTEFQANSVIEYLRLTDKYRIFAMKVLKILIEDRRTTHRERINNKRNVVTL